MLITDCASCARAFLPLLELSIINRTVRAYSGIQARAERAVPYTTSLQAAFKEGNGVITRPTCKQTSHFSTLTTALLP